MLAEHEEAERGADEVGDGDGGDGEPRSGLEGERGGEDAADAEAGDSGNAAGDDGGGENQRGQGQRSAAPEEGGCVAPAGEVDHSDVVGAEDALGGVDGELGVLDGCPGGGVADDDANEGGVGWRRCGRLAAEWLGREQERGAGAGHRDCAAHGHLPGDGRQLNEWPRDAANATTGGRGRGDWWRRLALFRGWTGLSWPASSLRQAAIIES